MGVGKYYIWIDHKISGQWHDAEAKSVINIGKINLSTQTSKSEKDENLCEGYI